MAFISRSSFPRTSVFLYFVIVDLCVCTSSLPSSDQTAGGGGAAFLTSTFKYVFSVLRQSFIFSQMPVEV